VIATRVVDLTSITREHAGSHKSSSYLMKQATRSHFATTNTEVIDRGRASPASRSRCHGGVPMSHSGTPGCGSLMSISR
jgi:hypothetical protein